MVFVCGFGNVNSFRGICFFEYCLDSSHARDKLNCGVSIKDWGNSRVGEGNLAIPQNDAYKPPSPTYNLYCLDCSHARDKLNCGVSIKDWGNSRVGEGNLAIPQNDAYKPPSPLIRAPPTPLPSIIGQSTNKHKMKPIIRPPSSDINPSEWQVLLNKDDNGYIV